MQKEKFCLEYDEPAAGPLAQEVSLHIKNKNRPTPKVTLMILEDPLVQTCSRDK
jgi:hypothetical protein